MEHLLRQLMKRFVKKSPIACRNPDAWQHYWPVYSRSRKEAERTYKGNRFCVQNFSRLMCHAKTIGGVLIKRLMLALQLNV